jgi:hypothetical protein
MKKLNIAEADQEAFVLSLALGTLKAIRIGAWPTDAGIWTLSRPRFREPLETIGLPPEVLDIFEGADELSALEQLRGRRAVDELIDKWIETLCSRLAVLSEKSWYAYWDDNAEPL